MAAEPSLRLSNPPPPMHVRLQATAFLLLAVGASSLPSCGSSRTADSPAEADLSRAPLVLDDAGGLPGSPMIDPGEVLMSVEQAGGLTKLPLDAANRVIDAYVSALAQRADSDALVGDLKTVRAEINKPTIDGPKVGRALTRLGDRTTAAADGDAMYSALGTALTESGAMLLGK